MYYNSYTIEQERKKMWIPIRDRILVKRVAEVETSRGGIIIPDNAKEKQSEGIVIAVGEGKRDEKGNRVPLDVQVDDRIIFGKYAGVEVKVNDETFLTMSEGEVLMKLPKEN